jgi:hypothetical protein
MVVMRTEYEAEKRLQRLEQFVDENKRHWVPLKEVTDTVRILLREKEEPPPRQLTFDFGHTHQ